MDIREIAKDPEFKKLPREEQIKAFSEFDPDFSALPRLEQDKAVNELISKPHKATWMDPVWADSKRNIYKDYSGKELRQKLFEDLQKKQNTGMQMQAKDFAPAVLGALGTVGGAVSPVPGGAAIGGVLGYMGGKQFNRAIGLEQPAATVLGAAKQSITQDMPEAMTAELVGVAGGKIAKGIMNAPTNRTITPEMVERIKLYEKAKVPYTAADIRQEKGLGLVESNLRRDIASATTAQKFDTAKLQAVKDEAARVEKIFGGKTGELEAGQEAQKFIKSRYRAFMDTADKLYKAIPAEPDMPIETPKYRDTAIGYLDELGDVGPKVKNILGIAERSMDAPNIQFQQGTLPTTMLTGKVGRGYIPARGIDVAGTRAFGEKSAPIVDVTGRRFNVIQEPSAIKTTWSKLNSDRSEIRKLAESTGDPNKKRILYDIVNAINDDVTDFAKKYSAPEFKAAVDKARDFYRSGSEVLPGANVFRNKKIVNTLKSDSPEKIVSDYIRPQNASNIVKLSKAAGPGGMKEIKSAWVSRMFEQGPDRSFSPAKFVSTFDNYRPSDLNAFLTKDEIKGLKALRDLSETIMEVEKMAGNPSGTAQVSGVKSRILSFFRSPILTTIETLGTKEFADRYFTDKAFRNKLIYGSSVPFDSPIAKKIADSLNATKKSMGVPQDLQFGTTPSLASKLTAISGMSEINNRKQGEF